MANEVRPRGYWVEIPSLRFDEDSTQTWIQAIPLGHYDHPTYGEIDVTPEKIAAYAASFDNNVRGIELDVDYDHKEYSGEAAGWIKQVANRGADGLWVLVDWTKKAYDQLKQGAYKYFSPEFADEWPHPKSGETHKDVLFGGAITNRPFLKDIQPINMSEIFGQNNSQGEPVDELMKELTQLLGLPEDVKPEDLLASVKTKLATPPPKKDDDETPSIDEAALASLVEKNPAVKALADEYKTLKASRKADSDRLAALEFKDHFNEVREGVGRAAKKLEESGFALAPAWQIKLTEELAKQPKSLSDGVITWLDEAFEKGIVELTERGRRRAGTTEDRDPTTRMSEAVKKLQEKDPKLSFADAAVMVSREDPDLFEEYADGSYAGEIGSGV